MKEIVYCVKNSPMFRYELMYFYRRFILENDVLIEKDKQKYKEELAVRKAGHRETVLRFLT